MNLQKPKTKIKLGIQKKYKEIFRMNCPTGYWNSERILVDEITSKEPWGNPEQRSQDTSKSSHELHMKPRAEAESGSGKHSVYTHFPKEPNYDICRKAKITRASCRRRVGAVVPRAEHVGDCITTDHK